MNLTAERVNRGLGQTDAASAIGVSRGTLDRAERGLPVQASKAKLIADFYQVLVTDIWPVPEPERSAAA